MCLRRWKGHEDWWGPGRRACCVIHHSYFDRTVGGIEFISEAKQVMRWCQRSATHLFPKTQVWGQTSDVIMRLGEEHRPSPCILSGDGYLQNPVSKSQWRERVRRANAMKEMVNGPKWWPYKLFPFQCVHYGGWDVYLECCVVSIHQSYASVQPWKRSFIMCGEELMALAWGPSEG